ncbi:M28 family peptidase [Gemmatimonadota bacterium]
MRRLAILTALALPGVVSCQAGVTLEEAVASINEEDFLNKVLVIAHDSMMGRANPSPGLDMTAQYVADEFRRYGLEPGGDDGTFIQGYAMREMAADFENSSAQVTGGATLGFGADLSYVRASGGGAVTGDVVLVTGTQGGEDSDPSALNGKHVIIVPDAGTPQTTGRRRMRFPMVIMNAEPASVIMVAAGSDEEWNEAVDRQREQTMTLAPWDTSDSNAPILSIRETSLAPILASHGVELAQLAAGAGDQTTFHPVSGLELTVTTAVQEIGSFVQPNTVGILEGSDPELRDEYIVYSAHMDHVGTGRPNEQGDSIYNGADDDASGTILVVEVAEAMAMLADRPKRSMIFLGVSGEERGLWGSRFFAENPPVPLEQIVANLNADMVSRNWPDTVVAIGKEHSDLGETLNRVNEAHPELHMIAIDDIWPEQNFYRRSDHFNFARRGVPILFFFTGVHEDYHRPTDDVSRMDAEKGARISQLLFYLGLELGNAPERPQWNPDSYSEIVDLGGGGG